MRKAKIYRYCLPMDSGVILRDNKLTERTGYIVELSEGDKIGRGEVAPLVGFSLEGVEEAGIQLQAQVERWVANLPLDYNHMYPSVAFGLSMAQLELEGGLPTQGKHQVAPLCNGDPDDLIPKLNEMEGEKVAKVKVGLYEPIRDGMLVNLFLESIPQLTLRLDANRAWTPEKAQQFAKYIAPSLRQRITFLEEPCRSPGDSLSFAINTGIAIAWDETLQDAVRREDFSLEDLTGVKTIIIKPTLIGSVDFCIKLIEKAKTLGIKAVISSSIESSLGLNQLARLAQWQLPNEIPGLDTIGLFKAQLEQGWTEVRSSSYSAVRAGVSVAFSVDDIAIAPWKYWAQVSPFSIALETNKASLNWQQLAARISHYVHSLQQQGVMNGDVVTLVGKNQVETLWFYLAAQQLGATVALTMPQPFEALSGKLTTLYKPNQQRFVWFADGAVGLYSENQLSQLSVTLLSIPDTDTDDVSVLSTDGYSHDGFASIVFTSGSTGTPKAVVHTHRQHLSSAQGLLAEFRFDQQDTWLLSLPLYHVSGLAIVYRWLFAGATIKVGSGSLADDIVGVSHASLVSTQLKRLLDEQVELSLTHVLLGGSHVAHELALRATQQGIETWLGYGMTEAASTVTAKQIDSISNAGHLLQNRDIKLEEQRIYIGGLTLATGYFNQGSITSLLNDDGWFDSKDLGEWQGDELKIIGRADNQFISGGENVHCEEIEAVLNQIEGISQSIVVPVEDAEFGHRPVAVIQTESLLSKVQYEQYLKTKLEKFKWPVAYYAMPQTLLGGSIKVSRKAVKDWLKNEVQNGD